MFWCQIDYNLNWYSKFIGVIIFMKIYESYLNFLGKIPVIQEISGTGRIIYGICKIVKNYTNQDAAAIEEYKRGKSYIGRGLIEIVPIISTVVLGLFDVLNRYAYIPSFNNPQKKFKYNIEFFYVYPSERHLFTIGENGRFFQTVNQEMNNKYGRGNFNRKYWSYYY